LFATIIYLLYNAKMAEKTPQIKILAEGVTKQKIEADNPNDFRITIEPRSELPMRTSEHDYFWQVKSGVGLLHFIRAGSEHMGNPRISEGISGEIEIGDQFGVTNIGQENLEVLVTKIQ
jgi:mannose-6-phosphate isomerase-like protein (cupin superfamily)